MRSIMSYAAKRQLIGQVGTRYRLAVHPQKSLILTEVVAATGYTRKYAIRLLTHPKTAQTSVITRSRARRYGPEVQAALTVAWRAANGICSKRLVPFLPELVPILERHGHLALNAESRSQLLTLSAATADRLLRSLRQREEGRGKGTTKPGSLLKRQIPLRTFAEWDDARPGFLEADLVAHCGSSTEGAFLQTLVLTDITTCWTECLPLLHRSQHAVTVALDHAAELLPMPILGLDTDNGGEFINELLVAYCDRHAITFTRGRVARKNDQCFVEQKNGAVVREVVGYDRFEGERAYRQLAELYKALRLYINFFQPSMKLASKTRVGSATKRTYDRAATPLQRLLAIEALDHQGRERLQAIYAVLDPVRLLRQIGVLQDALWSHAILGSPSSKTDDDQISARDAVSFNLTVCGLGGGPSRGSEAEGAGEMRRKYHRRQKAAAPRWWRTRADPFAEVWPEIEGWLKVSPESTALSIFIELQDRYPDRFPAGQLRTLQRRVKAWRQDALVEFDAAWLKGDVLAGGPLPPSLRATTEVGEQSPETSPVLLSTA